MHCLASRSSIIMCPAWFVACSHLQIIFISRLSTCVSYLCCLYFAGCAVLRPPRVWQDAAGEGHSLISIQLTRWAGQVVSFLASHSAHMPSDLMATHRVSVSAVMGKLQSTCLELVYACSGVKMHRYWHLRSTVDMASYSPPASYLQAVYMLVGGVSTSIWHTFGLSRICWQWRRVHMR